jgi:hypothetical protein
MPTPTDYTQQANLLIDDMWLLLSTVRENEEITPVAQVIRFGDGTCTFGCEHLGCKHIGDFKFIPLGMDGPPHAAKDQWAKQIRSAVSTIKADIVLTVSEAYLPPPGMEQAAMSIMLAGGTVADIPDRIEAVVMSVDSAWGKTRLIWREIKNEKLCGPVNDQGWTQAENSAGRLSNFFAAL